MDGTPAKYLMALLAMFATLFVAQPLRAQDQQTGFAPGSVCIAEAPGSVTYADLARDPSAWRCDGTGPEKFDRVALHFDLRDRAEGTPAPDHLRMTRLHFETMQVIAVAADGTTASRTLSREDLLPGDNLREAAVALPHADTAPVAIALVVEGAPSAAYLVHAQPVTGAPLLPIAGYEHLLAALLCGLLLAPFFFDLGFYRTLRSAFTLYHGAFCVLAVLQTATFSGLLLLLTDLSMASQRAIAILSFDCMVAAGTLFIVSFVEKDVFRAWQRKLLYAMAGLCVTLSMFVVFALPLFGDVTVLIYYVGYVAYLAALAHILIHALRMGSVAIRWILLSYTPLLLVGVSNVVMGLFAPEGVGIDNYWWQNMALAFEVVVTAYAVADRFLKIKRERDLARAQQGTLADLATRDPLTGLLNRRAIDEQFNDLHRAGYDTFALIDLDHFKAVNDAFGHQVGDSALQAVAKALEGDSESLAIRLGGEEFLVLLRGDDATERAEKLRQAITIRIARDVVGLDRVVTASMGMVSFPHAVMPNAGFTDVYARADQLLYEAKEQGRNRTVSERLKLFRPRKHVDRRSAA